MKKLLLYLICGGLFATFYSCKPSTVAPDVRLGNTDYFPLQVGNYWKIDDNDYLEITGTQTIGGHEFFEITSKNPRGTSQLYVRIDNNLNLVQAYSNSSFTSVIANFGLKKGEKIEDTLEKLVVIERTDEKLVFRYKCLPCSQGNATFDVAFHKNQGLLSRNLFFGGYISGNPAFKEIRINGKIYRP